jgi:hypothetical protein
VGLHDRKGRAAAQEVAVVAAAGVVVLEPALELGVEVGQASEVLAVEGGPVELLEGGPLEAFADGVVVGRAGRDAMVVNGEVLEVGGEPTAGELGAVELVSTPVSSAPMPASRSATWSTKPAASRADLSPATRAPIP